MISYTMHGQQCTMGHQLLGQRYFWFLEKVVLTKNRVKQVKWNQLIKLKEIRVSEGISVS